MIVYVHALSEWETTLRCDVVSHWHGAYTKWSLNYTQLSVWTYFNSPISQSFSPSGEQPEQHELAYKL